MPLGASTGAGGSKGPPVCAIPPSLAVRVHGCCRLLTGLYSHCESIGKSSTGVSNVHVWSNTTAPMPHTVTGHNTDTSSDKYTASEATT